MMNSKILSDLIIKEIKEFDKFNSVVCNGGVQNETVTEFSRIYEQTYSKASVIRVPSNTRFRFIKRVIGKLIRIHTRQQMDFNYQILDLILLQQQIILQNQERIKNLAFKNDELKK